MIKRRLWVAVMAVLAVLVVPSLLLENGRIAEPWPGLIISGLLSASVVGFLLLMDESLKPTWGVYCFCFLVGLAIPLFSSGILFELCRNVASVFAIMLLSFGFAEELVRRCYMASPRIGFVVKTALGAGAFGVLVLYPMLGMGFLPSPWYSLAGGLAIGAQLGAEKAGKDSDEVKDSEDASCLAKQSHSWW